MRNLGIAYVPKGIGRRRSHTTQTLTVTGETRGRTLNRASSTQRRLTRMSQKTLYASKTIMPPEREAEEHLDPSPGQTDSRYAEGPLRESGPAPENAAPPPRAAAQTRYGDQ